jgi:hypothetical protein
VPLHDHWGRRPPLRCGISRFTQQRPDGPLCITHVDGLFSAYDRPELATLASNTATQSTWRVDSGGRIGFAVGEDAVKGGCTPQRIG